MTPFEPQYTVCSMRLMTDNMVASQKLAENGLSRLYEADEVEKIATISREHCVINGLPSRCGDLIRILFYHRLDKTNGPDSRPVEWWGNEKLAEMLRCSTRSIQRYLKALAEIGLIAFQEQGNGKRHGGRDGGQKSGIDLTPAFELASERTQELAEYQQRLKTQKKYKKLLRNKKANLTKWFSDELARLEAGDQARPELEQNLREKLDQVQRINADKTTTYAHRLECLDVIEAAALVELKDPDLKPVPISGHFGSQSFKINSLSANLSCSACHFGMHIYTKPISKLDKSCNQTDISECETTSQPEANTEMAFEDNESEKSERINDYPKRKIAEYDPNQCEHKRQRVYDQAMTNKNRMSGFQRIDVQLLNQALPAVCDGLQADLSSWRNLVQQLHGLRVNIGLSETGLQQALKQKSPEYVALCAAIVLEKCLRDCSSIRSPGGYFMSLIRLPDDEAETKLCRTLFGLMRESHSVQ